ncbi:MAG: NAD(P)-dependent oxidoreductase [Gemmatimonadetes bacterium]|nr:NAD(P)-dependent oxidoreductase [Gemmatimonadota bacterium]
MAIKPKLSERAAERNMAEIEPAYRPQEATIEADRCLYCFDAPCIHSCPTGIDIPGFIKKIANDNLTGAARTILRANVLGASCARVCPTEVLCEGACVLLDRDETPIKIGRLQRYATDHAYESALPLLHAPAKKSGKRVAIIGGGPAGLSCAAELAQLGHEAVIYERHHKAGGLNTYGIAYYKMKPSVALAEVRLVQSLGVEILTDTEVGKDVPGDEIMNCYDAVFLAIGLGATYSLGIPGEDLPGVVEALAFIEELRMNPLDEVAVGDHVAVIGCGNTAIDAATQAKRLGAKRVTIVYRRGPEDMPAFEYEYELAKSDGVEFLFHTQPVEALGTKSRGLEGLRLVRTEPDLNGRPHNVAGSEFDVPFDMVIKALGQQKLGETIAKIFPGVTIDRRGAIERDFATGITKHGNIYAGGDAANGGSEVVDAVAEGKRAAAAIHVSFTDEAPEKLVQTTRLGAPDGATGAGIDKPVRVVELERAFRAGDKSHG